MSVKMEIWGETACFTRPEMKAERLIRYSNAQRRPRNAGKCVLSPRPEMVH